MQRPHKTSGTTRAHKGRGRLIASLLTGSWRESLREQIPTSNSESELTPDELAAITPLLCQSGAGALAWWRIRNTALAVSAAGEQLHQVYRRFRLSALIHEREIAYLFSLLRAEDIEPVLVKGWAIARRYPDRALRPYGDIDICVRPDQFARAAAALKCLESLDGHHVDLHAGFEEVGRGRLQEQERTDGETGRLGDATMEMTSDSRSLASVRRNLRLTPGAKGTSNAQWDQVFSRTQLVPLGADSKSKDQSPKSKDPLIRIPSDEDHLRILCLHLLRSGAWRPLWLCDVALVLETRKPDFNWDICLTNDPLQRDWIAGTIGLAHHLLGAESEERSAKRKGQSAKSEEGMAKGEELSAKSEGQRAKERGSAPFALGALPLPLTPLPFAPGAPPPWLLSAVERQWDRCRNSHVTGTALPPLVTAITEPKRLFNELYVRWDNPVRATVALNRRFNHWPRWPYQLGELFLRSPEAARQLATMVRRQRSEISRQTAGAGGRAGLIHTRFQPGE